MNEKYLSDDYLFTELTELNKNKSSLRVDNELFDDESNVIHKLIRARRVSLPRGGEDWEIVEDEEVVFTIRGVRLTKKEKEILRTVDGLNLLINEYRSGVKSVAKIKTKLKNYLTAKK